MKYGDSMNMIY